MLIPVSVGALGDNGTGAFSFVAFVKPSTGLAGLGGDGKCVDGVASTIFPIQRVAAMAYGNRIIAAGTGSLK